MNITKETRLISYYSEIARSSVRRKMILDALRGEEQGLTAEELATKLGFSYRGAVAPRLTELSKTGLVATVGKRKSPITGKNTAIYVLKEAAQDD